MQSLHDPGLWSSEMVFRLFTIYIWAGARPGRCPGYPIHWSSPYLLRAWGQSKLPSSSGSRAQQCWQWTARTFSGAPPGLAGARLVLTLSSVEETNKIIFIARGALCEENWNSIWCWVMSVFYDITFLYLLLTGSSPHLPLLSNFGHYIITNIKGLFSRVSPLL